jgi:predicted GNAT family acetyltransferase
MQLRHEPAAQRFVAERDGRECGVLEYRAAGERVLDYYHTYVPPEFRGQGIAGRLVEFALDEARRRGCTVRPSCPFVARFIAARPDYQDLLEASA